MDASSSEIAHQTPQVMSVWETMGPLLEDMSIVRLEPIEPTNQVAVATSEDRMKPPAKGTLAAKLRDYALGFPEAFEDFPWGERAFKVRSKVFVFLRADADALSFSVKLPHTGAQALALPFTEPTHYGLGKHGWVSITVPKKPSRALTDQFEAWIRESYRAVAPKKLAASVTDG